MEPQWDPTIEEQALSRVYRLGQAKEVTTVRFITKNSIEDVSCRTHSLGAFIE
jgi:SNF2 family DNA or RNA helicase